MGVPSSRCCHTSSGSMTCIEYSTRANGRKQADVAMATMNKIGTARGLRQSKQCLRRPRHCRRRWELLISHQLLCDRRLDTDSNDLIQFQQPDALRFQKQSNFPAKGRDSIFQETSKVRSGPREKDIPVPNFTTVVLLVPIVSYPNLSSRASLRLPSSQYHQQSSALLHQNRNSSPPECFI